MTFIFLDLELGQSSLSSVHNELVGINHETEDQITLDNANADGNNYMTIQSSAS